MDNVTHYYCPGTCHGVSADQGVCQADVCTHKGMPLMPCGCTDGTHAGAQA